jgi:hypothetical protein
MALAFNQNLFSSLARLCWWVFACLTLYPFGLAALGYSENFNRTADVNELRIDLLLHETTNNVYQVWLVPESWPLLAKLLVDTGGTSREDSDTVGAVRPRTGFPLNLNRSFRSSRNSESSGAHYQILRAYVGQTERGFCDLLDFPSTHLAQRGFYLRLHQSFHSIRLITLPERSDSRKCVIPRLLVSSKTVYYNEQFSKRDYFALLALSGSVAADRLAIDCHYNLARGSYYHDRRPVSLRKTKTRPKRDSKDHPKWVRIRHLGSQWATVYGEDLVFHLDAQDIDISENGKTWFHLLGPTCKDKLPKHEPR